MLVATAVVLLAIGYAATSASVFALRKKNLKPQFRLRGGAVIAIVGLIFSIYLITQCSLSQIGLASVMVLVGVPIYVLYSPKKELTGLKESFVSNEARLERAFQIQLRFLAHPLYHIRMAYKRRKDADKK
jgi:amino acid transporter